MLKQSEIKDDPVEMTIVNLISSETQTSFTEANSGINIDENLLKSLNSNELELK